MSTSTFENVHLSEMDPDFAPMVPAVNDAFKKIWIYQDIAEFRKNWTRNPAIYAAYVPSEGFEISHEKAIASDGAEIELRIYRPESTVEKALPLLFVLHGGGWVVGGHDSENSISRSVCVKNEALVISVDYRRAPENVFPCALLDCFDAFKWTLENATMLGIDTTKVVLYGTSSGANLAAALALKIRNSDLPICLAGQVLNVPVTCHPKLFPVEKYELNSYEQNAESPTTNSSHMRWFWDQYDRDATPSCYASPLLAKCLAGLPPTLIQVAGLDPLRDEGIAYAKALRDSGVSTDLELYPGLPHGFMLAVDQAFTTRYYKTVIDWLIKIM